MYRIPSDFTAPFELATRYRGKPIYIYEFVIARRRYFGASVRGQMLQVMELTRQKAITRAKEIIEIVEDEKASTPEANREQRERFAYEKGEGY